MTPLRASALPAALLVVGCERRPQQTLICSCHAETHVRVREDGTVVCECPRPALDGGKRQ